MRIGKLFTTAVILTVGITGIFPYIPRNPVRAESPEITPSQVRPQSDISLSKEWQYNLYGSGIGSTGLAVSDINNDGIQEVVASAVTRGGFRSSNLWYVLRKTGVNSYSHVWTSEVYTSGIKQIAVGDVNGDGIAEIFVGLADNQIMVYRGTDYANIGSFTTAYGISSLVLTDADSNGSKEVIVSDGAKIIAYDAIDYHTEWSTNAYGSDLAVGNVDKDLAAEIVTSSGYVLDGATRTVEWNYPATGGFGVRVEVGDVDGDGMAEIVGAAGWNKITVFDVDLQSATWEIPTSQDIQALTLADVDGNGRLDIIYGDGQWGSIHFVDGSTHQQMWSITNPEHGVTNIAVGDTDNDQALEVLWGAGYTSSGADYLYVAGISTHTIEWQSEDLDGPLSAIDTGDVDDDGQAEIVMASYQSNSGYNDGVIKIFDGSTHDLEWQLTDLPNISTWSGVNSVRIGDVDQDGTTEFVLATANLYDGLIQIYNGRTHTLERQSTSTSGASFTAMEIGDVDGDAQAEIVIGQMIEHSGATGVHVIVYDGATAVVEWQSIGLDTAEVYDIDLADIDGDSHIEIIASAKGGPVYIFDGTTHIMDKLITTNAYSLTHADLDQDGTQSIYVGRSDGTIDQYNGKTYSLENSTSFASGPILCLSLVDINLDTIPEWLICASNRLSVYSATIPSGTNPQIWQSVDLGASLGNYNQVPVGQIDQDINLEVVLGSMLSLYQFESSWAGPMGLSQMTVSKPTAEPGDQLTYSIALVNQGQESLNVTVTNPLPTALNYVDGTLLASDGSAAFEAGTVSWTGVVLAGGSATVSYDATVKVDAPRGKIENSAQVSTGSQTVVISVAFNIPLLATYLPICVKTSQVDCGDYFDDFQNASTGWPVSEDADVKMEYTGGEFRILGKTTGYVYLAKAPTCKRQSYVVETDARWAGTTGSSYGLIFGLADDFNQYFLFAVNTDYQDYALYYRSASGFTTLVSETYSSAIHSGTVSNHLKVTRNGSQVSLAINGVTVATRNSPEITGLVNVGLFNAPYTDLSNADARFDNFSVKTLVVATTQQNPPDLLPEGTAIPRWEMQLFESGRSRSQE